MKIYYRDAKDRIKEGFIVERIDEELVEIRDNVDKYRPEHFHHVFLCDIKYHEESEELDFLLDLQESVESRIDDIWYSLRDVGKEDLKERET